MSVADTVAATLNINAGLRDYDRHRLDALEGKPRRLVEQADEDLTLLCESAAAYQDADASVTMVGFLDQALGLRQDPGDGEEAVEVSTFHRSKGCEATVVYLCAAEDGIAPSRPALAGGSDALESRRRAF